MHVLESEGEEWVPGRAQRRAQKSQEASKGVRIQYACGLSSRSSAAQGWGQEQGMEAKADLKTHFVSCCLRFSLNSFDKHLPGLVYKLQIPQKQDARNTEMTYGEELGAGREREMIKPVYVTSSSKC